MYTHKIFNVYHYQSFHVLCTIKIKSLTRWHMRYKLQCNTKSNGIIKEVSEREEEDVLSTYRFFDSFGFSLNCIFRLLYHFQMNFVSFLTITGEKWCILVMLNKIYSLKKKIDHVSEGGKM